MPTDEPTDRDTTEGDGREEPRARPGRPRKYESDADRVRAFRLRRKAREQQGDLDAIESATPSEAVGTLERTLEDIRTVTTTSIEQFNVFARQITAAVDKLTDPDALDAAIHRANVELAQSTAKYEADLAELRARHDAAVEDRANADAAVDAVDAELTEAVAEHRLELERLARDHEEETGRREQAHAEELRTATDRAAAVEADHETRLTAARTEIAALLGQLDEARSRAEAAEQARATAEQHAERAGAAAEQRLVQVGAAAEQRIADLRGAAEQAAATAASTTARLEKSVDLERAAATTARERADALRDDLERARVEASQARTAEAAMREQVSELRAAPRGGQPADPSKG